MSSSRGPSGDPTSPRPWWGGFKKGGWHRGGVLTLVKLQYDKEVRLGAQEMRLEPGALPPTHLHVYTYLSQVSQTWGVPQLRYGPPQTTKGASGSAAKCH